jgi:hypothetical protein
MDTKQAYSPILDKDIVKMARVITKYVRFLSPRIVAAVAADNRQHAEAWRERLKARGVDPRLYLWDGSSCCFPGVRRHADQEKAAWKAGARPFRDALALDFNEYPQRIWTELAPEVDAQGYTLYHPLNHLVINAQIWASLEENDYLQGKGIYGLFTSAANIVFMPMVFIPLVNTNYWLRTLLVDRATELYGEVSSLLPPLVNLRRAEGEWNLRAFEWAPCEGEAPDASARLSAFLSARRATVDGLLEGSSRVLREWLAGSGV